MKQFLRLLLASALLVPAMLSAATFEGKVTMKMTSPSRSKDPGREIIYSIKGDKVRIEMPGEKASGGVIMDTTKHEMLVLMNEQKMYMTMATPDMNAAIEKNSSNAKFEKTSETEKILGYTATKYIATQDNTTTDLWLAEGLGSFMGMNQNPMGGRRGSSSQPQQAWEKLLAGKELFPLRVVGHDKSGAESHRMEVTAIDKQSLPDSLFTPPEGYQKFEMGNMMKGMMEKMGR